MTTTASHARPWVVAFVLSLIAAISGWGLFWSSSQQTEQVNTRLTAEQENFLTARKAMEKSQSSLSTLTTEKKGLIQQITALQEKNAGLVQQVATIDSKKNQLGKQVETIDLQLAQAKQKLATANNQQSVLSSLKQQLETRLETLTKTLKNSSESLQAITDDRDQILSEKETLHLQLTALGEKQTTLQQLNSKLQEQIHALDQEQKVLRQQNEISKQHNAELTAQLNKSSLDIEQLNKQLSDRDLLVKTLQVKFELASSKINTLELQNQDLLETRNLAQELQSRVAQLRSERARFKASLAEVKTRLQETLHTSNVKITQLNNNTTAIRLGGDITFALASAELSSKGKAALDLIAKALNAFPSRLISVEGHTDPLPLRPSKFNRYPSNWELSAARSASAVRYLISRKVDPKRLRVVGYSAYRPLTTRVEEYSRDRRIVILLLPLSGEQIITKKIPVKP